MIPILYPRGQTVFYGNGLGRLIDSVRCRCTETLNGGYELELQYPKSGLHANDIDINCIIKAKPNHEDYSQPFRIYSVEKNYDGYIYAKAAHISYDVSGIPVLPFKANKLSEAIDKMNSNQKVIKASEFVLAADFDLDGEMTVSNPASLRSLLGGTDNTLSYIYGGEYHYDSYTITLMSSRGSKKGVCFRYGKNITDFEQTIDCEDLYSSIFGFWRKPATDNTDEVLIYGNIIDVENVLPYDKIYVLDTSSLIKLKDENNNDIPPTSSQIDDYVRNYIASRAIGLPNYSMKLTYADDSSIIQVCLGDTVGVIFSDYNIKTIARCSRVVYDSLLERNESVDIGVVNNGIAGELASSFAKNNE